MPPYTCSIDPFHTWRASGAPWKPRLFSFHLSCALNTVQPAPLSGMLGKAAVDSMDHRLDHVTQNNCFLIDMQHLSRYWIDCGFQSSHLSYFQIVRYIESLCVFWLPGAESHLSTCIPSFWSVIPDRGQYQRGSLMLQIVDSLLRMMDFYPNIEFSWPEQPPVLLTMFVICRYNIWLERTMFSLL